MPNAAAMIYESIWRDEDWRKLSRSAQMLYVQLLSQKELDCAGLLPLQPNKWSKGCDGLTVEQVWADLDELQHHRFAFYDVDTDEVLIRTQVRMPFIIKGPKTRASASRAAKLCASPFLRKILAAELRASAEAEFISVADELDPAEGGEKRVLDRVSEPYRNPIGNPIDTVSADTLSKPYPIGPGTGTGTGISHLGNYSRGEERPTCARHPNGNPNDDPCHGCGRVRQWDDDHASQLAADELSHKRRLRDIAENCPDCLGTLVVDDGPDTVRKCTHPYAAQEHAHA